MLLASNEPKNKDVVKQALKQLLSDETKKASKGIRRKNRVNFTCCQPRRNLSRILERDVGFQSVRLSATFQIQMEALHGTSPCEMTWDAAVETRDLVKITRQESLRNTLETLSHRRNTARYALRKNCNTLDLGCPHVIEPTGGRGLT